MNHVPTFTDFILEQERLHHKTTGSLTILLMLIENCAKIISSHVSKSGLVDILGDTGKTNASHEKTQKIDEFANELFVKTLLSSGQVSAIGSEELEEILYAEKQHAGEYIVFFDPLDGTSNVDVSLPIGTIFSIYKKDENNTVLNQGKKQIAAGYVLYGTSTMLVLTIGNGVIGFTLDPAIGSFLLSHPKITIPQHGNIYSINEGYETFLNEHTKAFLTQLKASGKYKSRYVGALVADMHRTLLKGGIFLYPEDKKQPEGKLRLMYEVNPFAFIIEQAGGMAISKKENPLEIIPTNIHQRSPIVIGSKENVEEYLAIS